jgi:hypothetical protein
MMCCDIWVRPIVSRSQEPGTCMHLLLSTGLLDSIMLETQTFLTGATAT